MTRRTGPRGWLILGICVAAGIALAVVAPGAGAGADRVKAACAQAPHGARVGWQHGHNPGRAQANQLACPLSGLARSTTQPAAPPPSLARVPAAQTALTLAAAGPDPAQSTPASPGTASIGEANRRIEVAANSATAINDSLLLVGLLLGFMLAVSGLVLAAGRRGGLAARKVGTLTQPPARVGEHERGHTGRRFVPGDAGLAAAAAPVTLDPMPNVGGGTAEEVHTDGGTWRGASLPPGQHRPAASPM